MIHPESVKTPIFAKLGFQNQYLKQAQNLKFA